MFQCVGIISFCPSYGRVFPFQPVNIFENLFDDAFEFLGHGISRAKRIEYPVTFSPPSNIFVFVMPVIVTVTIAPLVK
jgi:hypothetical protein